MSFCAVNAQTEKIIFCDTVPIREILEKDFQVYVGNELGVFLDSRFVGTEKRIFFHQEPPGVLRGLFIEVNRNIYFIVYTGDLKEVDKVSTDLTWNMDKLRKENVTKIELYKNDILEMSFTLKP